MGSSKGLEWLSRDGQPYFCEQMVTVCGAGETRVGIIAMKDIAVGEELSYNYRFQHAGQTAEAYR